MLIYATISRNSDANGISRIGRQKLAEITGVSDLDTVTKHTNRLEYQGLLTKRYTLLEGKKRAEYHLSFNKKDFIWVSNQVASYPPETLGLLLKLAMLR